MRESTSEARNSSTAFFTLSYSDFEPSNSTLCFSSICIEEADRKKYVAMIELLIIVIQP